MRKAGGFLRRLVALLGVGALGASVWTAFQLADTLIAEAQVKPAELKVGIVAFLSGPAAVFGVPMKNAAEWLIEKYNREGGIGGVKVRPVYIDEAGGPSKQVVEFRRLVFDEKVDLVIGYISSADCLAVAPVAEELKMLTVFSTCGTHRIFEDARYKYVFRAAAHQTLDSVAAARYILAIKPDVKTIAGINQDYAWGRDTWETFKRAMLKLKPDVKVVAEIWPKLFAGEYPAEISKLLLAKPDVIHSSFWAGDLITFVKQATPRGLFKQSLVVFPAADAALEDLGKDIPEGVVIGARGDQYFLHNPRDPLHREFVEGYKARYGRYPVHPSYDMYQAIAGVKHAFEKAIKLNAVAWPTMDQVIKALEGLEYPVPPGRKMVIRRDHNGIEPAVLGLTKYSPGYPFAILDRMVVFPPEEVNPPEWMKTVDWIDSWKR